jgi:chromosome segregation ATPase
MLDYSHKSRLKFFHCQPRQPERKLMTAEIENLVLEHLRAIRAKQDEHGERLSQIEIQLSAMGQQIGALTTAVYSGKSELDSIRRRVERIERRLELVDPTH